MKLKRFARDVGYPVLVISMFLLSLVLLFLERRGSDWHDFDVFYGAASAALAGKSIYIIVGQYHLPFWYPPWTAWFYVPYAIWPKHTALLLYQATLAQAPSWSYTSSRATTSQVFGFWTSS